MADTGSYPSHYIPDEGVAFQPGEIVRVDHTPQHVSIIEDPDGGYEVVSCRSAPELGSDPPMLRVNLRRLHASAPEQPWTPKGW